MGVEKYGLGLWLIVAFCALASITLVRGEVEYPYRTDFCMCNLDPHLIAVREKLEKKEDPPPTPTPRPTVEATPEPTTTETPTTVVAPVVQRKKRSLTTDLKSTGTFRENTLGHMEPTGRMVNFDGTVKIADDVGVFYDSNYNGGLCECTQGSTVKVGICIINVPTSTDYDSPTSAPSKKLFEEILPWLDEILLSSLKDGKEYVRVLPSEVGSVGTFVQPKFIVEFKSKFFLAEYEVKNAIEPALKSVRGWKQFVANYKTDRDVEGCIDIEDMTVEDPKEIGAFGYIRFVFIPAAIALFGLLVFCLCCGKKDKFYVRFW